MSSTSTKWAELAKRHPDPAIRHFIKDTLALAQSSGNQAIIDSLEKGLGMAFARVKFTDDSTSRHSETCKQIDIDTWSNDWNKVYEEGKTTWNSSPGMISSGTTGQFLKSVVSATKAKDILEIGTFTGYTAIVMAEALPDDGKVVTIDRDQYFKDFTETHTKDSTHKHKVEVAIGEALDIMNKLAKEGKSFDLVFMDADKSEYPAYLKLCMEGKLLKPGGLIMVDNAFTGGRSYNIDDSPGAKFATLINDDPSLHKVLVPIKDGIYFIQRREDVDGGIA